MAHVAEALLKGGVQGSTSDDCKDLGNKMLSAGKHEDAIYFYTLGLSKKANCHILNSNRSAAYAKMGNYIERGAALEGLGKMEEALVAYQTALKLDTANTAYEQAISAIKRNLSGEMDVVEDSIEVKQESTEIKEESMQVNEQNDEEMKQHGDVHVKLESGDVKQEDCQTNAESVPIKEEENTAAEIPAELTPFEKAKARGNKAFASGNYEDAIDHFSTAISIEKNNHVLYSNRSAAYAGAGQMQSALADAQKCINLKPDWAKGYGRKAVALRGLNRIPMAISAYKDGLRLEPDNKALKDGLAELEPPAAAPKTAEEESAMKAEDAAQAESKAAKAPSPPPMADEDLELLSSFLSETTDLERRQQVERIIKYKLNPFEVLQLKPENATEEELNAGYRKLSLMVHPDKCKHPKAEEAFELCKKALAELQNEDKRNFYVEIQTAAREEAVRELKKKRKREKEEAAKNKKMRVGDVDKLRASMLGGSLRRKDKDKKDESTGWAESADAEELTKEDEDTLVLSTREAAYRILTQLEKRRARAEKVFIENEKRVKEHNNDLKEKAKHEEKVEKEWGQDRLDRIESWRDFEKHGKKMGIRKPKPAVTEKGVSVLPPTMGGFKRSKEEQELDAFMATTTGAEANGEAAGADGGGDGAAPAEDAPDLDAFLDSV